MSVTATALRSSLRYPPQDPKERKDLYNLALQTVFALESQQDTAQRLYHGHVPLALAQTGIDVRLFETVSQQPDKAWTVEDLATATRSDLALLCKSTDSDRSLLPLLTRQSPHCTLSCVVRHAHRERRRHVRSLEHRT